MRLAVIEWVCRADKWVALVIRILPTDRRGEKRRKKRKTRGHKRRGEGSIRNLSTFICSSCRHPFLLLSSFCSCFRSFYFILFSFCPCHLLCWSCFLVHFPHLILILYISSSFVSLFKSLVPFSSLYSHRLFFALLSSSLTCPLSFFSSLLPVLVFLPPFFAYSILSLFPFLFLLCSSDLFVLIICSYFVLVISCLVFSVPIPSLVVFLSSSLHSAIFFSFFLSPSVLIVTVLFSYLSPLSSLIFVLVFSSFGLDSSSLSFLNSSPLLVLIFFSLPSFLFLLIFLPLLSSSLSSFFFFSSLLFFSTLSLIYLSSPWMLLDGGGGTGVARL